ncbi:MAG: tetratricopeptide repeat protein [Myxococcota bacterium]
MQQRKDRLNLRTRHHIELVAAAFLVVACLVLATPEAAAQSFEARADTERDEGTGADPILEAFERGEYDRARQLAEGRDDSMALLIRAKLAEFDNDLALAERFSKAAFDRATEDGIEGRAIAKYAHIQWQRGDWDAAEETLRSYLSKHARAHEVRVRLGQLLMHRGETGQARTVLSRLENFFNNGLLETSRELVLLGRAMELLESYSDANYAYEQAYKRDDENVDGLVEWGELFMSKYNIGDARQCFEDALKVNENHPGALLGMARVEMESSNYYDKARAYLDRAAKAAPDDPRVLLTRAELQIYDSDCGEAVELADDVLEERPRHLESMVVKAACHFLGDRDAEFEAQTAEALSLKPDFARLFSETARYSLLVHRYTEAVELYREALELSPEYPDALLGIGIGLTRIGREDEGVRYLEKAFKADPYNVRAFNMVELYEKTMPDYEFTAYDGFRLRTHKSQQETLAELMPPLIDESIAVFEQKYEFEARDPVDVEIYPNPATFGVRSVGLPNISPHGVCFGRVVIARSPSDGNFNWRQVVWHEMAHVYHIQKANYRVPRWFTEGLAEYETNVKDPAWIRHHDTDIVSAMREGDIPSVVELDKRFTQARSYKGILQAYHLSSLVIHYIVGDHGFGAINEMLDAFAEHRDTSVVIETVLGMSVDEFDRGFSTWLQRRYRGFNKQFVFDITDVESPEVLREKIAEDSDDPVLHARLAASTALRGQREAAENAIEEALELDDDSPEVQYVAAFLALKLGRAKDAYEHATKILDMNKDGYELRVLLGHIAMTQEDRVAAEVHLSAATQLWPDGSEAWSRLRTLGESKDDEALEQLATRRLYELDQNNPLVARQYTEMLVEQGDLGRAADAVERWISIDPFQPDAHRAAIEVGFESDDAKRAANAYDLLATIRPDERADVFLEAARAFERRGYQEFAGRYAGLAREAGATQTQVDEALKGE